VGKDRETWRHIDRNSDSYRYRQKKEMRRYPEKEDKVRYKYFCK